VTPAPWLLALALVLGLLVLIPARRLQLSGLSGRAIGLYVMVLWLLAMVIAIRPMGLRVLVPIVLIAYLAPFIAGPDQVRRLLRRPPPRGPDVRPPMKDVTPPDPPGTT
jgi:hypothetical protein